jgi:hypothetical protein
MNLKISDTALDLGVFALDNEFENSSATRDRIIEECFAVAS